MKCKLILFSSYYLSLIKFVMTYNIFHHTPRHLVSRSTLGAITTYAYRVLTRFSETLNKMMWETIWPGAAGTSYPYKCDVFAYKGMLIYHIRYANHPVPTLNPFAIDGDSNRLTLTPFIYRHSFITRLLNRIELKIQIGISR